MILPGVLGSARLAGFERSFGCGYSKKTEPARRPAQAVRCRYMDQGSDRLQNAGLYAALLLLPLLAAIGCGMSGSLNDLQVPPLEEGAKAAPVQLFREVVSFKIGGGKVEGQAFYYFRNTDSVTRAFPAALQFFVSNWQDPPQNLVMARIQPEADTDLAFAWLDPSCPLTQILVPPMDNYCLRVDWEQSLSTRRFAYILRREKPWNNHREMLRLTIQVPPHYRKIRTNHPASHKFRTDQSRSFVIAREDFTPAEDLLVTWEE